MSLRVVVIILILLLFSSLAYAAKYCPVDGEVYPDSDQYCGKHGVKLTSQKPPAAKKAVTKKTSGKIQPGEKPAPVSSMHSPAKQPEAKPVVKQPSKIYVYYSEGKIETLDFRGFNTDCNGYGTNGITYAEQGISITIPWRDVTFILPEYGKALLKNGHVIENDVLKKISCSEAHLRETKKIKVLIDGIAREKEEEIQIPISDMEVIAFDSEGLQMGTSMRSGIIREEGKKRAQEEERRLAEIKRMDDKQKIAEAAAAVATEVTLRQKEAMERERQDLARVKQELDGQKALDAEREQLAAERRKLEAELQQIAMSLKDNFTGPREIGRDGRFIAYYNGTVLDTKMNLMWAAKDNGNNITWENANSYCENYRGGGYNDWRMPTQNELVELYDGVVKGNNGFHLTTTITLTRCCPWASTTNDSNAASFDFFRGKSWDLRSGHKIGRVLPVRSSK